MAIIPYLVRLTVLALALMGAQVAVAANMATCILDTVPNLQSDAAARAAYQVCLKRHPEGLIGVPQGDGRGWFGFDSGAACVVKKAADTRSDVAGRIITTACNRLYNEPKVFDKFGGELVK